MEMNNEEGLYPELQTYISEVLKAFGEIPEERKEVLEELAQSIGQDLKESGSSNLLFMCTHNSRRSHMSQVWAKVAGAYYGIAGLNTFSGGTEVTAVNPRAVAALQRAGFRIEASGKSNPRYKVRFGIDEPGLECYSKTYDDAVNPQENFTAIMTCSDADRNCPIVPGADKRFLVSYEDPKLADNTPEEAERYDERCRQIATEMLFVMSKL